MESVAIGVGFAELRWQVASLAILGLTKSKTQIRDANFNSEKNPSRCDCCSAGCFGHARVQPATKTRHGRDLSGERTKRTGD